MTKDEKRSVRDAITLFMGTADDWTHGMELLSGLIGKGLKGEVRRAHARAEKLRDMSKEERLKDETRNSGSKV